MYRTPKMHELILKGVPDQFRGETWILFSGAVNEVNNCYKVLRNLRFIFTYTLFFIRNLVQGLVLKVS